MAADLPIPIILDTDIGDNVDDSLALAFACQCPELNLVGISTTFCDPRRRAEIALALLDALGFDNVPVAVGTGEPLIKSWPNRTPRFDSTNCSIARKTDEREPVAFLIETFRAAVGPWVEEVETTTCARYSAFYPTFTVCCIGPLTNLALALVSNASLAKDVRIVLMGGMFSAERPETNISADPAAAKIVIGTGGDITMVGLDVTLQCQLTVEQVEQIKACEHAHAKLLGSMIDAWMAENLRLPVLHDPLAVAMCFDSDLCTTQPMAVTIESSTDPPGALTKVHPPTDHRIRVCTAVDRDRFMRLFLDRICSPPRRGNHRS
jgi:inosine-uridine nucleoside N-ribohydrolase